MNQKEKLILMEFARKIAKLNLLINCEFSTYNYDYEVITYVDEVQILDADENIVVSIRKEDVKDE
jgi:hypothetical protein